MRKFLVATLTVGLIAGALTLPAAAKKSAPQALTFYFHGPHASGEVTHAENTANALQSLPNGFQTMDTTEGSDPAPDSMGLTNYVRGPNRTCSGNGLFPTWQGPLTGKVSGDMKVYINAIAGPATNVIVEVFPDSAGGCDSTLGSTGYVPPVATATATLTPGTGETEVVLKGVKFTALSQFVIMISPTESEANGETILEPTSQGRVLYDNADFASRVEFLCTPTSGSSCIPKA